MANIEIAKILKPQGIKGEVKALPLTNVLAVFNNIKSCLIGAKEYNILHISLRQGFLYIKFDEVKTRNDAELLRNQIIMIDKNLLEQLKAEDEFLIEDLIGMLLYNQEGQYVGQIMDVENYGACDVFIIEKDGRKHEVPYVDEVFIAQNGTLIVNQSKFDEVCIWKLIYLHYFLMHFRI